MTHKSPAKPGLVSEGLGLVAQRDISRNEVVLEVPKNLWINPESVAASEIGSVCGGLKPWVCVALFLIREKMRGGESWWWRYIDVLPECTDSTIFWWVSWLLVGFVFLDVGFGGFCCVVCVVFGFQVVFVNVSILCLF